jgi:hypothetical protein
MRTLPLAAVGLALLAGCDKAKKFIDPTGQAYGTPATPATAANGPTNSTPAASNTAPASSASTAAAHSAPPPPPAGRSFDAPIRAPAVGRNLTAAKVAAQVSGIEFEDDQGKWTFKNGVGKRGSAYASWVDSAGKPWGLSIGDVDMDGADDAVLLVRMDQAGREPSWELAFLKNQAGVLYDIQTVDLPGSRGYRDVDIQGNSVILVPEGGGPNVELGFAGGALSLSRP